MSESAFNMAVKDDGSSLYRSVIMVEGAASEGMYDVELKWFDAEDMVFVKSISSKLLTDAEDWAKWPDVSRRVGLRGLRKAALQGIVAALTEYR